MSIALHIEPATLEDLNALLALENATFLPADSLLSRRAMRYHLQSRNLLLVARILPENKPLAGYLLALRYRKSLRIYSLAVDNACRQRGVATALLQETLRRARESAGLRLVTLEVRLSNLSAQRLYARLGWQPRRQIPAYYLDGEAALRMEMSLEQAASAANGI